MSLERRTFLCSFLPLALLLVSSFWAVEKAVVSAVRDDLRSSLREQQTSLGKMRQHNETQNGRALRAVGENSALKAGLQLMLLDPASDDARLTVEDQLRELCGTLGFEFLVVSGLDGAMLAGIMQQGGKLVPLDVSKAKPVLKGLFWNDGIAYQVTSVPVDQGEERMAVLSVGERFTLAELNTPAVLMHNGAVLESSLSKVNRAVLETSLGACRNAADCEIRLDDDTYVSLAMENAQFSDAYELRSLQNLDAAVGPVQTILRTVFLAAGAGALLVALIVTAVSSRSIVKPIATVVGRLRQSESTGVLPYFDIDAAQVQEVRELTESFNRAAAAIREGQDDLHRAYVECVGSLASALDARDPYTAGHSKRVSEFSCVVGEALGLDQRDLHELRVGALLHDIGKIGLLDSVLQKPGPLTPEEFQLIRQHPAIGRRILEGVHGFAPYLSTVELHHENWNGTGYPHGLQGEATPLAARIVHVADAYDAMTSDRPYRRGMSSAAAVAVLKQNAGAQFDPAIVAVFAEQAQCSRIQPEQNLLENRSLQALAVSVADEHISKLKVVTQ